MLQRDNEIENKHDKSKDIHMRKGNQRLYHLNENCGEAIKENK
jgi:hypothetical protein